MTKTAGFYCGLCAWCFLLGCCAKRDETESVRKSEPASAQDNPDESKTRSIAAQIYLPRVSLNDLGIAESVSVINLKIEEQLRMMGHSKSTFQIRNEVSSNPTIFLDLKNVSIKTLLIVLQDQAAFEIQFVSGGVIFSNVNRDRLD